MTPDDDDDIDAADVTDFLHIRHDLEAVDLPRILMTGQWIVRKRFVKGFAWHRWVVVFRDGDSVVRAAGSGLVLTAEHGDYWVDEQGDVRRYNRRRTDWGGLIKRIPKKDRDAVAVVKVIVRLRGKGVTPCSD